jgi:hypothetical protein
LDECCLWDAARLCSVARQKKRDALEVKNVVAKNADESTRERAPKNARASQLLHIDEEVALEDVLPFFVLLGLFIRFLLQHQARGS